MYLTPVNQFWAKEYPAAISSGLVTLVAHDFFTAQPPLPASLASGGHVSVFFLRFIIHDWPDKYAKKILVNLRAAATSETKLILSDYVVPYATPSGVATAETGGGPETALRRAPAPLLANWGLASAPVYGSDFQVWGYYATLRLAYADSHIL